MMASEDFVPPLAANMTAAFKNVRGVMGDDPTLRDQIATKIVELAKVEAPCRAGNDGRSDAPADVGLQEPGEAGM